MKPGETQNVIQAGLWIDASSTPDDMTTTIRAHPRSAKRTQVRRPVHFRRICQMGMWIGMLLMGISAGVSLAATGTGTLQFSQATYTVKESAGKASVTVTRTGGSLGIVTVDFATSDDTAIAGTDYTATNGTLSFGAGVTSKSFSVVVTNDTLNEPDRTLGLSLSNATGGAVLGVQSNAVLVIKDDDPAGVISFAFANYSEVESTRRAAIAVVRTGGTAGGVTVDYATADGTATDPSDYLATNGTLTFIANEVNKVIFVTITNDTRHEPNETVLLSLSNPTGGAQLGAQSNAVLTIIDDDPAGTISFSNSTFSVNETGAVATLIVTRYGGTARNVGALFTTMDGTAVAGVDYEATNGVVIFGANAFVREIQINILPDTVVEGNETFFVVLHGPFGGATLGGTTTATVTIGDDKTNASGLFMLSGSVSISGRSNRADNGSYTGKLQLLLQDQVGSVFEGDGLLIATSGGGGSEVLTLTGNVTGPGRVAGTLVVSNEVGGSKFVRSNEVSTGTFSGTISGKSLSMNFAATNQTDHSKASGSLSGGIYMPTTNGFAPAFLNGYSVTNTVTKGSGIFSTNGTYSLVFSPDTQAWDEYTEPGHAATGGQGAFIYTKTAANTATLLLDNASGELTTTVTLTFTSTTGGTFKVAGVGQTGSQSGTFTISSPP